ncbi:uncharacterized protein TNCV_2450601 [Trichonephila clavipes]|nr:uncharacterized protein TNCV_2450601 [Trichonephila clavipes]
MMYASQIHRILSRDRDASRYFIGVFPSDEIPLPKERATLVVNTDTRDQEGSHWLAMYIKDKDTLEFFDSYGLPPEMYGVHIFKYAEQFTNVKWNKKSIQSLTSNVCGLYCVYFLLKISRGYSMDYVLYELSRTRLNDFRLYQYFKKRYNVRLNFRW